MPGCRFLLRLVQECFKTSRVIIQSFAFLCRFALAKAGKALLKAKAFRIIKSFRCRNFLQFWCCIAFQQLFLHETPLQLFQIQPAVSDLLPDALQQLHGALQLQDMLLCSGLKCRTGQPPAQQEQCSRCPMKKPHHTVQTCRTFPGVVQPCSSTNTRSIPCRCSACTCGRRGCWEAYSSATALIRQARQAAAEHPESLLAGAEEITGKTVFDAADRGDETANAVVDRFCDYLGAGVTNIVNALAPEVILIGGGISRQGERLLAPVRRYVEKNCFGGKDGAIPIIAAARLGNDAGIIGAAAL